MRICSTQRLAISLLTLGVACTTTRDSAEPGADGWQEVATTGESSTANDDPATAGEEAGDGDSGAGDSDDKFDVAPGASSAGDDGGGQGCDKVDFLFVIDNSGSMQDEQDNLIAAFPEFIATIESTVAASDYHVMVVDTDAALDSGNCHGNPDPVGCCELSCSFAPDQLCAGMPCPGADVCAATMGSGRRVGGLGQDCGIVGDQAYLTSAQPNIAETFACVASVGTHGDGHELPMRALLDAVGAQATEDGCNAGFLRDDAILVVVVVTDEEDDPFDGGDPDPGTDGGPTDWYEALVSAKGGHADAIVVLGLVGDTDLPGAVCPPPTDGIVGAEPAPRLRAFVELFGPSGGLWGSVCQSDYASLFEQAVGLIDTTCDEFDPEG